MGTAAAAEADKHQLSLFGDSSTAIQEHLADKRRSSLKAAAQSVDDLNKE